MDVLQSLGSGNLDYRTILELIKLAVIVPVFLFWSLYDLLTKTVRVKWQRTLIAFGLLYNFAYLFVNNGTQHINDNITGFVVCYLVTYLYALTKRVLGLGDFGQGDIMYCAIIGLLFGTAVGVLTIILSFVIFDGLLNLVRKIFRNLGAFSVAFFPFITAGLFIIIFLIGESNVREAYSGVLSYFNIKHGYIKVF